MMNKFSIYINKKKQVEYSNIFCCLRVQFLLHIHNIWKIHQANKIKSISIINYERLRN